MCAAASSANSPLGIPRDFEIRVISPARKLGLSPEGDVELEVREIDKRQSEESEIYEVARRAADIFEAYGDLPNERTGLKCCLMLGVCLTLCLTVSIYREWNMNDRRELREASLRELVTDYLAAKGANEWDAYLKKIEVLIQCRDKVDAFLKVERDPSKKRDLIAFRHGIIVEKARLFALYQKELLEIQKKPGIGGDQPDKDWSEIQLELQNINKDIDVFDADSYLRHLASRDYEED